MLICVYFCSLKGNTNSPENKSFVPDLSVELKKKCIQDWSDSVLSGAAELCLVSAFFWVPRNYIPLNNLCI